jgi:hypothetical protein
MAAFARQHGGVRSLERTRLEGLRLVEARYAARLSGGRCQRDPPGDSTRVSGLTATAASRQAAPVRPAWRTQPATPGPPGLPSSGAASRASPSSVHGGSVAARHRAGTRPTPRRSGSSGGWCRRSRRVRLPHRSRRRGSSSSSGQSGRFSGALDVISGRGDARPRRYRWARCRPRGIGRASNEAYPFEGDILQFEVIRHRPSGVRAVRYAETRCFCVGLEDASGVRCGRGMTSASH